MCPHMIEPRLHLRHQHQRNGLVLHTSLVFLWPGLSVGVAVVAPPPGFVAGVYTLIVQGCFDQLVVYQADC